jgi:hypothetical protein
MRDSILWEKVGTEIDIIVFTPEKFRELAEKTFKSHQTDFSQPLSKMFNEYSLLDERLTFPDIWNSNISS